MEQRGKTFLRITLLLVTMLLGILPCNNPVCSQVLPSGATPERTLKPPEMPLPGLKPTQERPAVISAPSPSTPPRLPEGKITLRRIVLSGVTVYNLAEIQSLYAEMLNREVAFSDLYGIANRITAKYHADGYALSQAFVPGQEINVQEGVVQIWVVEGSLASFRIVGDPGGNRSAIERYAKRLLGLSPLRKADLERYLLLMNDLPGAAIEGFVSPGDRGLQNAELILNVGSKKTGGVFGVDNRGSKFFGPNEIYTTIQGNALLGLGELIEISPMLTGDAGKLTSWGGLVNFRVPIFSDGAYLQAYAAGSKTNAGGYLEPYDLRGQAVIGTLAVGYPFLRELGRYVYGAVQFDYISTREDIYTNQPFIKDELRVLRGHLAYGASDSWGGENFLNFKLSLGINGLGASSNNDPLRSRTNANSNFVSVYANALRRQSLSMIADDLRIVVGFQGQYSPDPLLSGEEFGLGGPVFLRAYDYYDIAGDYGIAARVELQYSLPFKNKKVFNAVELFAFYDIGKIWNHDPLWYELSEGSLASAGGGFRLTVFRYLFGSLYAAQPLTRDVTANQNRDTRYFFQLGGVW